MRILLVNYEYPPLGGGGGIETRDLAEALAAHHEVHVLTTAFGSLPTTEIQNGVTIHRVRVWGRMHLPTATIRSLISFIPAALIRGLRIVRTIQPDVVNAHFVVPSGIPALVLARVVGAPLVLTLIGGDIYDPSKGISPHRHTILRWIIGWLIGQASALTAISQDTKERAMQYHRAPTSVTVIPLGLVPPAFTPLDRRTLGFSPGVFHWVTVGRLIPRKGYTDLLEAFSTLSVSDAILHVVGDGPTLEDLQEQCQRLNIVNRVVFHGPVSDEQKFQLLHASDAYVSSSYHEGFGICFLEAMYVGLPIVATDTGGQTDFLVAEKHAILVPPHRPEHLASAMETMMREASRRTAMSRVNKEAVQEYLVGRTAQRYDEVFQKVVHGPVIQRPV